MRSLFLYSLAITKLQEKKWGWKVGIGFVHHLRENLDFHLFNKTLLKIWSLWVLGEAIIKEQDNRQGDKLEGHIISYGKM